MKVFSPDKCFVFGRCWLFQAMIMLLWQTPQSFYRMTLQKIWEKTMLKACTESLINLMTGGLNTGLFEAHTDTHAHTHTHTHARRWTLCGSLAHTQCRQRLRRLKWCIRALDAEHCIINSPHSICYHCASSNISSVWDLPTPPHPSLLLKKLLGFQPRNINRRWQPWAFFLSLSLLHRLHIH